MRALVCLLLLWCSSSWALTDTHTPWWNFGTGVYYETVEAACRGLVETPGGRVFDSVQNMAGVMPTRTAQCYGHTGTAAPAYVNSVSENCAGAAGWTQDATLGCKKTVTTCPAPRTPDVNGICQPPTCPASGVVMPDSDGAVFRVTGSVSSTTTCINSCSYQGIMSAMHDGAPYVWGPMTSLGHTCTGTGTGNNGGTDPPPSTPVPDPPKPGTCPGTVNGLPVVVPCDETSTPTPATAASGSSTGSGAGSTTSSSSTGSTTCKEGMCTTTTTTTTTTTGGTGSGTTTGTSSTTQTQGEFCAKNPGNAQCTGTGGGGGGGGDGEPCEASPNVLGCLDVGTPPAPAAITQSTVTASFAAQGGWGADNGSCPAPVHTTSLGNVDPYALFCTYAAGIRFAVIGFAFMVAVLIFLGRTD